MSSPFWRDLADETEALLQEATSETEFLLIALTVLEICADAQMDPGVAGLAKTLGGRFLGSYPATDPLVQATRLKVKERLGEVSGRHVLQGLEPTGSVC